MKRRILFLALACGLLLATASCSPGTPTVPIPDGADGDEFPTPPKP